MMATRMTSQPTPPAFSTSELQHLEAGTLRMTIDPHVGGRIVSFTHAGREILTPKSVHPTNYGSTFWDAPQSAWDWPPRTTLDNAPYAVIPHPDDLHLASQPDAASGLTFRKRFHTQPKRNRIEIIYTMVNTATDRVLAVAPWEVTRVTAGLSVFPARQAANTPASTLPVRFDDQGLCWYRCDPAVLTTGRKLFSGAKEGWIAHLDLNGLLFIKQFAEIGPGRPAPGQGEVEIWGQDGGIYVELENHGPLASLRPGDALEYRVNWYLMDAPSGDERHLVRMVRQIIADNPLID